MFGKINEKAKNQAYLKEISERNKQVALERAARPQLSGRDAVIEGSKEVKIQSKAHPRAIINNHIADMKYYSDWRERLLGARKPQLSASESGSQGSRFDFNDNRFGSAERDDVAIGRERGMEMDEKTVEPKFRPSTKSIFDRQYPEDTGSDVDDDLKFLDDFFARRERAVTPTREEKIENRLVTDTPKSFINRKLIKRTTDARDNEASPATNTNAALEDRQGAAFDEKETQGDAFGIDDFEQSILPTHTYDEIVDVAQEVNHGAGLAEKKKAKNKPSAPRKKKKKFDADIIGASGFFTFR